LKLQSDELLSKADVVEEEFYFQDWDIMPEEIYDSCEELDYTSAVISEARIPLKEKIWHKKTRPVTLMELVDAFSSAKKDVEKQKKLNERKRLLREMMSVEEDFDEKVHGEDLEEDIYVTWERICSIEEDKMLLDDLIDGTRDDLLGRFVSILFLAINNKIHISQRRFPYGEIIIKNITPVEERLQPPTVELVDKEEVVIEEKRLAKELVVV
jgi:chromatin segregation and condensation protein Rec8/ScpA/Scc1 (kleisin family)